MLTPAKIEQAKLSPLDFAAVVAKDWYQRAPHLEMVNNAVMRLARREIKRLMIFMPPQHGKSELISHFTPSWWVGTFPDDNILLASYGQDWADHWGRETRNTVEEYGQSVFGVTVADDSSAAGRWAVQGHRGGFKAAGIGGAITGRPADVLIIDDPVKNSQEAFSTTIHQRNIEWWASTAKTRLHKDSVVLLMQTRWHPNDLAGYLLGNPGWEVILLPALAEQDDMMGRKPGEALFPERFPVEMLQEIKDENARILDGYYWNAMYQQKPQLPEGLLYFDKQTVEWGKEYARANPPKERHDTRPTPEAPADGYVLVWERPRTGERYYIGADTADGKGEVLGSLSATGGPDRNAAGIFKASDDTQVAEIYGRQEEHNYARILNQWGRAYNNALLAVERNRRAVVVALRELNYPNLYATNRTAGAYSRLLPVANVAGSLDYGWNTDVRSRPLLLSDLREGMSSGAFKIKSEAFWAEAEAFMMGDPPATAPGQHDDRVFYAGITWQTRKQVRERQASSTGLSFVGGI